MWQVLQLLTRVLFSIIYTISWKGRGLKRPPRRTRAEQSTTEGDEGIVVSLAPPPPLLLLPNHLVGCGG